MREKPPDRDHGPYFVTEMWERVRVHICRNRCNRRLRKIFVDCVNFSVNNANCEQNLSHILRTCVTRANKSDSMVTARLKKEDPDFPFFCQIPCTVVQIGSCQINDDKVSIVHFHILMSFYSIYAILSQIRFCRDLRFFCVNFWGQKLRLRKFFDKYDV